MASRGRGEHRLRGIARWRFVLATVIATCALRTATAQTIYKWTDERGVVHFSDTPTEKRAVEELTFSAPPAAEPPRDVAEHGRISLTERNGQRLVNVVVEGALHAREVTMIVDTGARMTMIDEALADALDVEFVEEAPIVGVTGVASAWIGRVRRLRLGDYELTNWRVMVGPMPGMLLLGMDVLEHLRLSVGPDHLEAKHPTE